MARFSVQIVSPQTLSFLQSFARLFVWLLRTVKSKWRGFLWRFAPLWFPLLLIVLLPMPREIAQQNGFWFSDAYTNPLRHARDEPQNLGAQLNAVPLTSIPVTSIPAMPDDDWDEENIAVPSRLEWLERIEKRFPQESWLHRLVISQRLDIIRMSANQDPFVSSPLPATAVALSSDMKAQALKLKRDIESGIKAEPQNAFWVVQRALWEWNFAPRSYFPQPKSNFASFSLFIPSYTVPGAVPSPGPAGISGVLGMASPSVNDSVLFVPGMKHPLELPGPHPALLVFNHEPVLRRTLAILRRAQNCAFYDGGVVQAKYEMWRDELSTYSPPLSGWSGSWTEANSADFIFGLRSQLWSTYSIPSVRSPYAPLLPNKPPFFRLSKQEVFASGAAISHIGVLRDAVSQRDSSLQYSDFVQWFDFGWNFDVPPRPPRWTFAWKPTASANAAFASRASTEGYRGLARDVLATQKQLAARDALLKRANARSFVVATDRELTPFSGARALLPRFAFWSAAFCLALGTAVSLLAPLWIFLNIWLARGVGIPSSRRVRWCGPAVLILPLCFLCAWIMVESNPIKGKFAPLSGFASASYLSATPALALLCAIICSLVVVAHHRTQLVNSADDKWHTKVLPLNVRPWIEPLLLIVSALIVLVSELWYLRIVQTPGAGIIPLIGAITNEQTIAGLFFYGCASGFVALLIWLINWRWPPKAVRPITHSGLRWWKETIGASICILAWLYLFIAIAAWPARLQAKQMLDERWQKGDWAFLKQHVS